jgi:AAA+ ATPase superfamily predicted ATPase
MVTKVTDNMFVKLKNPYTFGVPVRGKDNFFGREEELQLIFDTLENVPRGQKQDMVILGPRRIGKSSLLYRLVDLLMPSEDFVPVYVDVQNIKPRKIRVLFLKILQSIKEGYKKKNLLTELPSFETLEVSEIPADLEFLTFDEDMSRLNEAIQLQNLPRLILLFDEVELLIEFGGKDTLDWFRSLIQSMLYTIFVVAGSEQLYSLTQDYGSPFYNIFKTVELYPLTSNAAKKLVLTPAAEIGMEIAPGEVDKILRYAGNNAYFIQGICHYLVELLNSQKRYQPYSQDVDDVIAHSVEHLSAQFAYIWGGVSQVQRAILYALAKKGQAQTAELLLAKLPHLAPLLNSKQAQQDTFDDLRQQQILKLESGQRYWFMVLLFVNWILSNVNDEEVLKLATEAEVVQIRQEYNIGAIRKLLTRAFSDEELTQFCYDTPTLRPVYEQFSSGMGKSLKIQILIEYVERKSLMADLLAQMKEINPSQYETFEKDLYK